MVGCETVGFYSQAIAGQWRLLRDREPIDTLLADAKTDDALKTRLAYVKTVTAFADSALALPSNGSYAHYVDIGRPFVTWNVFAAPEFSVDAKKWCYPIAGCVSYRGYFSEQAALDYAEKLRTQGFETYVGGVGAYSTLGWLKDPVLSNLLSRDDAHLTATLFHELSHQKLYVKGDTAFNESFATAVELEGIRRWFAQRGDAQDVAGYQHRLLRRQQFVASLLQLREQLAELYARPLAEAEQRHQKKLIIDAYRNNVLPALLREWQAENRLQAPDEQAWLSQMINNARLVAVADYHVWVPAFQQLLQQVDHDLPAFYRACEELAELPADERSQRLTALLQKP